MAKAITGERIRLKNVRASFLRIDKPQAFVAGQEPRFEATAILDPSNAEHAALIKQIKAEAGRIAKEVYGEIPKNIELCFGMANDHPKKAKYDGYKDMFWLACHNKIRPGVANRAANPVAPGEPQFPYSGCYITLTITLWAIKNAFVPRVSANLLALQFVKDGPAFGREPVDVTEEYEALEEVEDAPDPFA